MIVVTFFASGASLPLFFYPIIFSNYCHISSSTALSPVKVPNRILVAQGFYPRI
jgi:hypothetical protein